MGLLKIGLSRENMGLLDIQIPHAELMVTISYTGSVVSIVLRTCIPLGSFYLSGRCMNLLIYCCGS